MYIDTTHMYIDTQYAYVHTYMTVHITFIWMCFDTCISHSYECAIDICISTLHMCISTLDIYMYIHIWMYIYTDVYEQVHMLVWICRYADTQKAKNWNIVYLYTLQHILHIHTATHCNTHSDEKRVMTWTCTHPPRTATRCNTHFDEKQVITYTYTNIATHTLTKRVVYTHSSHCNMLQRTATRCNTHTD